MGWGSPSSGVRVKKQGKAGWAQGWGDGAEEDSERQECPLQMPISETCITGNAREGLCPQFYRPGNHEGRAASAQWLCLLSFLRKCSLVPGRWSQLHKDAGLGMEPGLHGQDLRVSRAVCFCYDSTMFCGSGPTVDLLVCH